MKGSNLMNFSDKKVLVCGMARSGISVAELDVYKRQGQNIMTKIISLIMSFQILWQN